LVRVRLQEVAAVGPVFFSVIVRGKFARVVDKLFGVKLRTGGSTGVPAVVLEVVEEVEPVVEVLVVVEEVELVLEVVEDPVLPPVPPVPPEEAFAVWSK